MRNRIGGAEYEYDVGGARASFEAQVQDILLEIVEARPDLDGYFMRADIDARMGKGEWSPMLDGDTLVGEDDE
jgi:hypothetical protein